MMKKPFLLGFLLLFAAGAAASFVVGGSLFVAAAGSGAPTAADLKQGCLRATIRGINLEIAHYQSWIAQRKAGTVQADDLPGLEAELQRLQADLARYQTMKPDAYPLPEKTAQTAWVQDKPGEGAILYVEGMSRSGPWYHLTGIAGDDYGILKLNKKYRVDLYKVYPRSYFNMESAYVYVVVKK